MGYLLPAEYEAFGLSAETADTWVTAASAMMDAYCRRPSLLAASYTERLRTGRHGQTVRLSYGPLVQVDAVRARFGRDARAALFGDEVAAAFCVGDTWTVIDVTTLDVEASLQQVSLPWNLLGARYSEVEVTYTAGLSVVSDGVKVACAQVVKNAQATPGLNVKSSRVDALQMEYFSDGLIDSQVQALLRPYVAERLS